MDDTAQQNLTAQQAADDLAKLTATAVPGIAEAVEEVEEKQDDYQAMYNAGGPFKEQLESIASHWQKESTPLKSVQERVVEHMEEIPTSVEVEKHAELAGYMEKIEKEAELSNPVTDDYQSILLSSSAPQQPKVTLPLNDSQIQEGLQHKVYEAVRWLAVWCLRQMKMSSRVI
jgi:hypothetical protein